MRSIALLLALASAASAQNSVGINAHLPANDELDACAELGVEWIRIDNNWFVVEPRPGDYRWAELDRVVDGALARGLRVFMTVAYAPAWAAERGADDVPSNDIPRAGLYAEYVAAVVTRYRDRVQHFGLWNEPNLDHFWEGDLDAYLERVLLPGADAVKQACAECFVLGPDLAGLSGWQDFMRPLLARAGDRIDIVTHHSYAAVQRVRAQWICDDFSHAIDSGDQPILCSYKPGLRQVLDEAGWDGEVWMTEVGYRADPWDDARQQRHQLETYQDILALQLTKPWWTTTFFYELTDCRPALPDCTIDGFGIVRRQAGPDDSWADNFTLKPAFLWLRGELQRDVWGADAEPPPAPEPEAPRIVAPRREPAEPDGDLAEWDDQGCVTLERYEILEDAPTGPGDLFARACAAWTDDALWLAVDVRDDAHVNDFGDDALWQGDSVQLALDPDGDSEGAYDDDDLEVNLALVGAQTRVFTFHGDAASVGVVGRVGDRTRYELRVALPGLEAGRTLRASFLVNDNDGAGREGWLEWTPGIGRAKDPSLFGVIELEARAAEPAPDAEPLDGGREPPPLPDPPDVGADGALVGEDGGLADAGPRMSVDAATNAGDGATPPSPEDAGGRRGVRFEDASGEGDEGCACSASGRSSAAWLLVFLLGLRRRGRSSSHGRGVERAPCQGAD